MYRVSYLGSYVSCERSGRDERMINVHYSDSESDSEAAADRGRDACGR